MARVESSTDLDLSRLGSNRVRLSSGQIGLLLLLAVGSPTAVQFAGSLLRPGPASAMVTASHEVQEDHERRLQVLERHVEHMDARLERVDSNSLSTCSIVSKRFGVDRENLCTRPPGKEE